MNNVIGTIESAKNLLNWTSPRKTALIFSIVVIVWLLSVFIKGRYLILVVGLYEFLFKFIPEPEGRIIYLISLSLYINSI